MRQRAVTILASLQDNTIGPMLSSTAFIFKHIFFSHHETSHAQIFSGEDNTIGPMLSSTAFIFKQIFFSHHKTSHAQTFSGEPVML